MHKIRFVYFVVLSTFIISCTDASIDKTTFKEYLFLINSDSLEYNPYGGTSVKTQYFIWNSIEYSGWLEFCILELKNTSDLSLDSIIINDEFNNDIGFSRFSNTTSVNNGHCLSYRQKFDFNNKINVDFSDISSIDTLFKSKNYFGFISKPTKFSLSDRDHEQQVIFNDEIRDNNIINLFYKTEYSLYFIQIKAAKLKVNKSIDYSFIKYLKLN